MRKPLSLREYPSTKRRSCRAALAARHSRSWGAAWRPGSSLQESCPLAPRTETPEWLPRVMLWTMYGGRNLLINPGRCGNCFQSIIFKHIVQNSSLGGYSLRNCCYGNGRERHWWKVKVVSGYGLLASGNKPLPEPMFTRICVAIWRHGTTMH